MCTCLISQILVQSYPSIAASGCGCRCSFTEWRHSATHSITNSILRSEFTIQLIEMPHLRVLDEPDLSVIAFHCEFLKVPRQRRSRTKEMVSYVNASRRVYLFHYIIQGKTNRAYRHIEPFELQRNYRRSCRCESAPSSYSVQSVN